MELKTLWVSFLLGIINHASSTYVAVAPAEFRPGIYTVLLTVRDVTSPGIRVSFTGNIFDSNKRSLGAGSVSLDDGQSARLDIQVSSNIEPDPNGRYTLTLDASGGLGRFSNSTDIHLAPLTYLSLVQTDQRSYMAGQKINFRVVSVNKEVEPQRVPKNITFVNPLGNKVARFHCRGLKAVFEDTYELTDYAPVGQWKIIVDSQHERLHREVPFVVHPNVRPKFEVSAEVTPGHLVQESDQKKVTVVVTAKYPSGKGVRGDLKLTILSTNRILQTSITQMDGTQEVDVNLSSEMARIDDHHGNVSIKVEVTDETEVTYHATVFVMVKARAVHIAFDKSRTCLTYVPTMPFQAVVRLTDPLGEALGSEYLFNQVRMTLNDSQDSSRSTSQNFLLTSGQRDVVWKMDRLNWTGSTLYLKAEFIADGKKYEVTETVKKYEVMGNASLSLHWTNYASELSMSSMASFMVNTSINFTTITYMVVSRGSVRAYGLANAGQATPVQVTTAMCPRGRLVVFGLTPGNNSHRPEVVADSLALRVDHCRGKEVRTSMQSDWQRAGTYTKINVDVRWTDPQKRMNTPVGQHDVFLMAVDKTLLQSLGDRDVNPHIMNEALGKFHMLPASWGMHGMKDRQNLQHHVPNIGRATSTGDLFQSLGLKVMGDVRMLNVTRHPTHHDGDDMDDMKRGLNMMRHNISVHKVFPDTWLWRTGRTNDTGHLSLDEKLPPNTASWVISAFAVKNYTEMAITAQPFELRAVDPFSVTLKLPCYVRQSEKFAMETTVHNEENFNMDTSVSLAPSDDYLISGDSSKAITVGRNSVGMVIFKIIASKVKVIRIRVTATSRRSNGQVITDTVEKTLRVKAGGMKRKRSLTFPIKVPEDESKVDRNVTLDFAPWTLKDVVKDSRKAWVKITGCMLGNALQPGHDLLMMPTGCGEQNMLTMAPSIYGMAYLSHIGQLKDDFERHAMHCMKTGYYREMQDYRWPDGGYSAFGRKDDKPSTWVTAFVVSSFAQARKYMPNVVDLNFLQSDLDLLYARQNRATGHFQEQGNILHQHMKYLESSVGSSDALSVYVVICLLEAKKYDIEIDEDRLAEGMTHVTSLQSGRLVRQQPFVAALTAYAMALNFPDNINTRANVQRLVGYIIEAGAPWKRYQNSAGAGHWDHSWHFRPYSNASDVEVTAYSLLAYSAVGMVTEGYELAAWLQKQQNAMGGYRSSQDTMMAVKALSEYARKSSVSDPRAEVVVTVLNPSFKSFTVNIDSSSISNLQMIELPSDTNKINIRFTGKAESLVVAKVVWKFHTAADKLPSGTNHHGDHKRLMVSTKSSELRSGLHHLQACVKPETGLQYKNMVMMSLKLPSGCALENILAARNRNPNVMRLEETNGTVHFYLKDSIYQCMDVNVEEVVKVQDRKPGVAHLYAYYAPEIYSEANIDFGCPDCHCTGDNCDASRAPDLITLSRFPLIISLCLVLSWVTSV